MADHKQLDDPMALDRPLCEELRVHTIALLKKNYWLSLRNKRATFLQLAASFFFMLFVFVVDQSVSAQQKTQSRYRVLTAPLPIAITDVPICKPALGKTECVTFAYSCEGCKPQAATLTETLVNNICSKNKPPIARASIKKLSTREEGDAFYLANPDLVQGAVHFNIPSKHNYRKVFFEIQFNSSTAYSRGKFGNPNTIFQLPLQNAVEREVARHYSGNADLVWEPRMQEFAHPAFRVSSAVGRVGPPFFFAAAMFGFVIQLGTVVQERETRLRQAMNNVGMRSLTFWLTWMIWDVLLITVSTLVICLFGHIFDFAMFTKNAFGLYFFLFFLFQLAMLGFAFFISTFLSRSSSATSVGFIIYVVGFIFYIVVGFGFPFSTDFDRHWQVLCAFFPPTLFVKGLGDLSKFTAADDALGLRWAERASYCTVQENCVFSLDEIFQWCTGTFFLYFVLALYFDQIMPDPEGNREVPWFCFKPSYWVKCFGGGEDAGTSSTADEARAAAVPNPEDVGRETDSDVERVEAEGRSAAAAGEASGSALAVRGLQKTFGEFRAVKGVWFEVPKNSLFCLLGPNGAGKTTTINMMVGNTQPTGGQVLALGYSASSDLGKIRKRMGICPQFENLWPQLSGLEHLMLFGSLKGLSGEALPDECKARLREVGLVGKEWEVDEQTLLYKKIKGAQVATYSGGEKRRLSVALALLGQPKLVYLDEPTTGMDPISRRDVWTLINALRSGITARSVILTTHSMEEADTLSDTIAIMALGRMRCYGTNVHLKQKFGAGYTLTVAVGEDGEASKQKLAAVTAAVDATLKLDMAPEVQGGGVAFKVPHGREKDMVELFAQVKALGCDVQLRLTSLEEVFLTIAAMAMVEVSAKSTEEVRVLDERLQGGQCVVQVPIGKKQVDMQVPFAEGGMKQVTLHVTWGLPDGVLVCIASRIGAVVDVPPAAAP